MKWLLNSTPFARAAWPLRLVIHLTWVWRAFRYLSLRFFQELLTTERSVTGKPISWHTSSHKFQASEGVLQTSLVFHNAGLFCTALIMSCKFWPCSTAFGTAGTVFAGSDSVLSFSSECSLFWFWHSSIVAKNKKISWAAKDYLPENDKITYQAAFDCMDYRWNGFFLDYNFL